jgi:hypothetical protein
VSERNLEDILPVYGVEQNCILSKQGDITIAFEVQLPEIFTLYDQEYEVLHQSPVLLIKQKINLENRNII